MDWLTFISKLVEALAWPAIVVWLLWYLKEHLPTLASSIRKLKVSGVEMEFERKAEQLAAETQLALPEAKTTDSSDFEEPEVKRLRTVAQVSPRGAIMEAWTRIETLATEVIVKAGFDVPRRGGTHELMDRLLQLDVLTAPQVIAFQDLRRLRNMAVHANDEAVTPDAVDNYIRSAVAMAGYLEDTVEYVSNMKK